MKMNKDRLKKVKNNFESYIKYSKGESYYPIPTIRFMDIEYVVEILNYIENNLPDKNDVKEN